MVVEGSRQKTLNPGFVLLEIHQQGVPVILRDSILCHPASQRIIKPQEESKDSSQFTTPMPFLTTTTTIIISTWSVRTIWEKGRPVKYMRK
ncbi:unnamed protein product [Schistosoma margrebowiei]|uniref:Uncharacterized protein n=1 Tax=Schistosoma margrebowiei TaxID=48269 RepID=A0A183MN34_9TREM|nr:unnamed protein product [Schistosoma margrebowiei]